MLCWKVHFFFCRSTSSAATWDYIFTFFGGRSLTVRPLSLRTRLTVADRNAGQKTARWDVEAKKLTRPHFPEYCLLNMTLTDDFSVCNLNVI